MDLGIAGKYALVTGGANGIGEGITEFLAKEGANVIFTSRDQMALDRMLTNLTKYQIKAQGILIDFLQEDWLTKFQTSISSYEIDILINNAGHNFNINNPYCAIEDWRKVMGLNFEIPVQLCNLVIPQMKKKGWGRIVNITSVAGLENSGPVTYGVSKAAMLMHTKVAAQELGGHGIRVNAVSPGLISRPGIEDAWPEGVGRWLKRAPLGRMGTPRDVGDACVFLCSPLAQWITGNNLIVDGGMSTMSTW